MHDVRNRGIEEIAIVRDQQQRAAVCREPTFQPDDGIEIEVIGRLVEQHQVRAADQRLCQVQSHAPATREVRNGPLKIGTRKSKPGQQAGRACAGAVALDSIEPDVQLRERMAVVGHIGSDDFPLDRAQFFVAVEHELNRGPWQGRRFLGDRGDAPLARHFAVPRLGVQFAAQQREQARLATAVGADHADPPAGVQLHRGVLDQASRAARKGKLPKLDHDDQTSKTGRAF